MIISAVIAILIAGSVYLVMQRGMVRIIIGTTLMSHGVNILLLAAGVGAWRADPIADRTEVADAAD
ncbi:MAG: NADH-quinone oxidoreductase subunit K, partial [Corynebacterium variabile]